MGDNEGLRAELNVSSAYYFNLFVQHRPFSVLSVNNLSVFMKDSDPSDCTASHW